MGQLRPYYHHLCYLSAHLITIIDNFSTLNAVDGRILHEFGMRNEFVSILGTWNAVISAFCGLSVHLGLYMINVRWHIC